MIIFTWVNFCFQIKDGKLGKRFSFCLLDHRFNKWSFFPRKFTSNLTWIAESSMFLQLIFLDLSVFCKVYWARTVSYYCWGSLEVSPDFSSDHLANLKMFSWETDVWDCPETGFLPNSGKKLGKHLGCSLYINS